MDVLQACVIGLLLVLGTLYSAVAQSIILTGPTRNEFCNGTVVTFTCETRNAFSLSWMGDNFYVREQIPISDFRNVNFTSTSLFNPNTVATLTENYLDGDVRVLVSTLRITALSTASSGNVSCIIPTGTGSSFNFLVLAPVALEVVTFQLERVQNMCFIASVLRSATETDVTNYIVRVDGELVEFNDAQLISTDGMRQFALLYESSCGTHMVTISADDLCGTEVQFTTSITFAGSASNVKLGSVTAAIVGVCMAAIMYQH